jgi:hypothetical protein
MSDAQIPNAEEQIPSIEEIFQKLDGRPADEQVPVLAAIIQALVGQLSEVDAHLSELDKEIHEQFFEPINQHYQDLTRSRGIDELKQKYGSKFNDLAEPLKAFGVDDVYSFLWEKLEKLKKEDGYTPDMGEASVDMFHKGALDRIGKIRGTPPEEPSADAADEKPAAVEVAIEEKPKSLSEKKHSMRGGY